MTTYNFLASTSVPARNAIEPRPSRSVPHANDASVFLSVESGDFVAIEEFPAFGQATKPSWWIAKVIACFGGARNPSSNSLFQVINIDTGEVKTINADLVKDILKKRVNRIEREHN